MTRAMQAGSLRYEERHAVTDMHPRWVFGQPLPTATVITPSLTGQALLTGSSVSFPSKITMASFGAGTGFPSHAGSATGGLACPQE